MCGVLAIESAGVYGLSEVTMFLLFRALRYELIFSHNVCECAELFVIRVGTADIHTFTRTPPSRPQVHPKLTKWRAKQRSKTSKFILRERYQRGSFRRECE